MNPIVLRTGFWILACVSAAYAQTAQFEVASVKPAAPPAPGRSASSTVRGGPGSSDPALARIENIDLFSLVAMAYGIQRSQLTGPAWLDSARFDINARIPPGATTEQYRLMLQNLLNERFNLELHHEIKELFFYEMTVAKNGPAVKPAPANPKMPDSALHPPSRVLAPPPAFASASYMMRGVQPMGDLADFLASQLGQPVKDATGLAGRYDTELRWSMTGVNASAASDDPDPEPAIVQAVREQLGLKLTPKKGPVDVLVVDRIEKEPTEN